MQLAETNPEMSFDTIQEELQINESEVESFIIDGKFVFGIFDTTTFYTLQPGIFYTLCKQNISTYAFEWQLTLSRVYKMN